MENNEIMVADEVLEGVDMIDTQSSGTGWKIAAGVGVAALVGGLIYKFVAKPIIAKVKAKKEQGKIIDIPAEDGYDVEDVD